MVASWRSTCQRVVRRWSSPQQKITAGLLSSGRKAGWGQNQSGTPDAYGQNGVMLSHFQCCNLCIYMWLLMSSQDDQRQGVWHRDWSTLVPWQGNRRSFVLFLWEYNWFLNQSYFFTSCQKQDTWLECRLRCLMLTMYLHGLYGFIRWLMTTRGRSSREIIGIKRSPLSEWPSKVGYPSIILSMNANNHLFFKNFKVFKASV